MGAHHLGALVDTGILVLGTLGVCRVTDLWPLIEKLCVLDYVRANIQLGHRSFTHVARWETLFVPDNRFIQV